ncbi:MAG: tRNA pseudouridine(38-40) synthase TruA, partial [Clostridium sp.]|nr:tRNA pseudouridine(38-40) synthase TruA [Clostridium sp.]
QGATVQGTLQQALSRLLRQPVSVIGAGRTDTDVNARMMIAHFDAEGELPADLAYRLNAMAGKGIAIYKIWPVEADAHARFDAKERTYRYFASMGKTPFGWPLTWLSVNELDFDKMNEATRYLIGRQDFTSFSKLHTQVKTNICDVRKARWIRVDDGQTPLGSEGNLWYFEISADRFLRNMVRAIVGTLVDVGRGKLPPEAVKDIIERRDRRCAGTSMPGHALYLWDIKY